MAPSDLLTQPRARGRAGLSVGPAGLTGLRQEGATKLLFPGRSAREAVLINTSGGITGGDRLALHAAVAEGAALTVTTQAAERAYAAQPGPPGRMDTELDVAGTLHWLPQETILFDRCHFARRLTVALGPEARFLMCEPVCFGRTARGEELRAARFRDRVEIRRDGRLIYLDGLDLSGDVAATLDRPAVAAGGRAMASVVLAAADAEAHLGPLRAALPATGGASLLAPDLLIARIVAADGFDLRRTLIPVLSRLAGRDLPRVWRT